MNSTEQPGARARGWPYVVTGTAFAGICAWISYNDGLFVARLAGNEGSIAFFYPLLPDGLIVLCLLALAEAGQMSEKRSRWAVAGLRLGIALTLAMNVYAGVVHSVLDAIIDGFVPVVFFIAAEVVLWHVRRARSAPAGDVAGEILTDGPAGPPATQGGTVPSSSFEAAKARMREAMDRRFRYSDNEARADFGLTRAEAAKARKEAAAERSRGGVPGWHRGAAPAATEAVPERSRGGPFPRTHTGTAPAAQVPAGALVPAPQGAPAGAALSANGQAAHG